MNNVKKVLTFLIILFAVMIFTVVIPICGIYKIGEPYIDENTQIDTETNFYGTVLHSINILKKAPELSDEVKSLNNEYERIIAYKMNVMLNLYIIPTMFLCFAIVAIGLVLLGNKKVENVISYALIFSGLISIVSYALQYGIINQIGHI